MQKGQRTRERLVEKALRLLARHGLSGTSFQAVADGLGLSQSAVLHHFPSKSALVGAVLERIVGSNHETVSRALSPEDGAAERLRQHFRGNLEWAERHPDEATVLVLLFYLATFDRAFRETYDRAMDGGRTRILEIVHAGVRERVFEPAGSPETASRLLHAELVGEVIAAAAGEGGGTARAERLEALFRSVAGLGE